MPNTLTLESDTDAQAERSEKEKLAEDIAYTVNHAVSCTALDLLGGSPLGSKLSSEYVVPGIQKGMRQLPYLNKFSNKEIHLWCSHPIGKWTIAEVAGDIGSVIPTIAIQRFAPGVFNAMESVLEPAFGWAYKGGARRGAQRWARAHNLSYDDQRVKDYQDALYTHEVEHLPHAFMWGAISLPISGEILTLSGHDPHTCGHSNGHGHSHGHGHGHSHGHNHAHAHKHSHAKPSHWKRLSGNMLHVMGGKIFSSVILLGARSIAPDRARQWDRWASDTVYYPVTKSLSGLLGVDEETVKRVREKHDAVLMSPTPQSEIHLPAENNKIVSKSNHALAA